jgi:hypothetical protein
MLVNVSGEWSILANSFNYFVILLCGQSEQWLKVIVDYIHIRGGLVAVRILLTVMPTLTNSLVWLSLMKTTAKASVSLY